MFKSIIGVLCFSVSLPTAAADWGLKGFNLDFQDGRGSAQAVEAVFMIDEVNYLFRNTTFDVREDAGNLVVEAPLDNFSYSIEAPFMADVEKARARNLNFEAIPGKLDVNFQQVRLEQKKDTTTVGRTTLRCDSPPTTTDPVDSCLVSGRLTIASLVSAPNRGDTNLENVNLQVRNGRVNFSVKVAGLGTINGEGTATHDGDKDEVRIRIQKVKYGILDVTGQFFSLIEDNQSDNLKVERPYLIISYGDAR